MWKNTNIFPLRNTETHPSNLSLQLLCHSLVHLNSLDTHRHTHRHTHRLTQSGRPASRGAGQEEEPYLGVRTSAAEEGNSIFGLLFLFHRAGQAAVNRVWSHWLFDTEDLLPGLSRGLYHDTRSTHRDLIHSHTKVVSNLMSTQDHIKRVELAPSDQTHAWTGHNQVHIFHKKN